VFSFKYAIINIVLGVVAGYFGSGYRSSIVNKIGNMVMIGAVIYTWYNFSFIWAVATFVELIIGATIYSVSASESDK